MATFLLSMKRVLPLIIVIVVGLATIGSGFALYRAKRPDLLMITNEKGGLSERSSHVLGPANAPVTLEEFGDFECPPCGRLSEPLNELERDFNPRLRVVFHNFPFDTHKHAREAACVAEAAGLQGKFWQMHDLLYHDQVVWANSSDARSLFNAYAAYIGLDAKRFQADVDSEEVKARVAADQKKGVSLGVKNTPTVFLNNQEVDPKHLNPTALREEIEAALKNAKPSH
jgi:protein-disulfide isomerase